MNSLPDKNLPDICNRKDIDLLMERFYAKARRDELLEPIFDKRIKNEDQWEEHLRTIGDFWETVLFEASLYRNNPLKKHQDLGIQHQHLHRWIALFQQTLEEHFQGNNATLIKNRANIMRQVFETKLN